MLQSDRGRLGRAPGPPAARHPRDDRDLVGGAAEEGERSGFGRPVLVVDDGLDVDPSGPTCLHHGHLGQQLGVVVGDESEFGGAGPAHVWRSPTAAANASSSARHESGRARGRTTNLENPTSRNASRKSRRASSPAGTYAVGSPPLRDRPSAATIDGSSGPSTSV